MLIWSRLWAPSWRLQTHAFSNSCSLSVFPTASGFDNGSRSAKRLNQAVRSEEGLAGSGEKRANMSTPTLLTPTSARLQAGGSRCILKRQEAQSDKPHCSLSLSLVRVFHAPLLAGWLSNILNHGLYTVQCTVILCVNPHLHLHPAMATARRAA